MYSQELLVRNNGAVPAFVTIRKKEVDPAIVSIVDAPGSEIKWKVHEGYIELSAHVRGGEETLFKVACREYPVLPEQTSSLKYQLRVAARRLLSELRDEYMFQSHRTVRSFAELRRFFSRGS
jgi:hypothetical protein